MEHTVQKKSWFRRNWPWVVPLGGCLTMIIIVVMIVGGAIFGISKAFTSSSPYQEGLAKATTDTYVIEELGDPVESNGIMQGSIQLQNSVGTAAISIPIKGPKGTGTVYVNGSKQEGKWNYSEVYVIIDATNEQVDLLWNQE